MENAETDIPDARIVALEKKVRDMEALATGLVNELLDLKSGLMARSRDADESSRQELRRGVAKDASPAPAAQRDVPIVRPASARQPDAPVIPAEPAMALIMQADGTMKMEPRCGDRRQTDSSGGYDATRRVNLSRAARTR
jgi:hypothetical protein